MHLQLGFGANISTCSDEIMVHESSPTSDSNVVDYLACLLCWRSVSWLKHVAFSLLAFLIMLSGEKCL